MPFFCLDFWSFFCSRRIGNGRTGEDDIASQSSFSSRLSHGEWALPDRTVRLPSGLIPLAALFAPGHLRALRTHPRCVRYVARRWNGRTGLRSPRCRSYSDASYCRRLRLRTARMRPWHTVVRLRSAVSALMVVQLFHILVPCVRLGVPTSSATSIFGSWPELGIISGLLLLSPALCG